MDQSWIMLYGSIVDRALWIIIYGSWIVDSRSQMMNNGSWIIAWKQMIDSGSYINGQSCIVSCFVLHIQFMLNICTFFIGPRCFSFQPGRPANYTRRFSLVNVRTGQWSNFRVSGFVFKKTDNVSFFQNQIGWTLVQLEIISNVTSLSLDWLQNFQLIDVRCRGS